ncbi:hypothetical protein [Thermostichus vulcanus]|uniref:Uncharacterized protein n=1 Tax=Thermostichus vulcanus str. 'Rupite' TaxID=2813851 RepID=A0ABT0CET8_THEVL|nr:hypothetical protein [Thermostichus vulcanus]MCJ2544299.1 hypothetical protein [Thermostichus vulcanus str. 'Rupite']
MKNNELQDSQIKSAEAFLPSIKELVQKLISGDIEGFSEIGGIGIEEASNTYSSMLRFQKRVLEECFPDIEWKKPHAFTMPPDEAIIEAVHESATGDLFEELDHVYSLYCQKQISQGLKPKPMSELDPNGFIPTFEIVVGLLGYVPNNTSWGVALDMWCGDYHTDLTLTFDAIVKDGALID